MPGLLGFLITVRYYYNDPNSTENSPNFDLHQPLIIAHRGSTQTALENTIAAFEAAISLRADMVEFDVRATQDQVLVIHHDPTINKIPINQITWADLQTLNPNIPTLESTIICCKNRILLDVELKETGYELATIEQLLKHLEINSFVITSFNPNSLQQIKQTYPQITIGLLLKRSWRDRLLNLNSQPLQSQITQLQPNFLALHHTLINTHWLQKINQITYPIGFGPSINPILCNC